MIALASSSSQAAILTLTSPTATYSQPASVQGANGHDYNVSEAIDGVTSGNNGWAVGLSGTNAQPATAAFEISSPVPFNGGTTFVFTLNHNFTISNGHQLLGNLRLSVTTDSTADFADGLQTGGDVTANWSFLTITSATATNGVSLSVIGPGNVLSSTPSLTSPTTSVYTIVATTSLQNVTGLRLEALNHSSLPSDGPGQHSPNGNFVLTEMQVEAFATVPEPASMAIWGLGLAGLAVGHRVRKRWRA